jgi:hypothetical protein
VTIAFLMTGRSLQNYRANGHELPADFPIVQCLGCGDSVTISPDGAARLDEARKRGDSPVGALCTPCTLRYTPRNAEIRATKFGAELIERRGDARAILDVLLKRTAGAK